VKRLSAEASPLLRRTALGALAGAALFGLVPLARLLGAGEPLEGVVQPLLWVAFLGMVVGALAGPLVGAAWAGWRARRGE
jgi:hypothetical protein